MGKIRNRKKWIAKPTRLSEGLRLARTRHKGFTQKSVAGSYRYTTSAYFRV